MNILVFGASGPLGQCIAARVLDAGHQVTAFVRAPGRLEPRPGLREITGDVLDAESVATAVPGHDAVVSALGQSGPSPAGRDLHPGAASIIDAMKAAQVSRLIWISSHGVGDSRGHSGFVFERIFVPLLLRAEFADKERQEAFVAASDLDWTIIRPVRLTNGPATGRVRARPRLPISIRNSVSRADVAAFVVEELETAATCSAHPPSWRPDGCLQDLGHASMPVPLRHPRWRCRSVLIPRRRTCRLSA